MVSLYEELKINKYAEPALIFMGSKMKREKFIVNIDLMASFLDEIGVKQGESVGKLSPLFLILLVVCDIFCKTYRTRTNI